MFQVLACYRPDGLSLVPENFHYLKEVFLYLCGCLSWFFNAETTVMWAQLVLVGDTEPVSVRYLEFYSPVVVPSRPYVPHI